MIAKHRSGVVFGVVALLVLAGCGSSSKELDASVERDAAITDAAITDAAITDAAITDAALADAAITDAAVADASTPVDAGGDLCEGVDCSELDGACQVGVCDPADGTCDAMMVADGTACDDGDACTDATMCTAGVCGGGEPLCPSAVGLFPGDDGDVRGGGGGTMSVDDCPLGQVLVGVDAIVGPYVKRLAAVCGTPSVHGTPGAFVVAIGPGDTLPERGILDGTVATTRCPADEVVVGFEGRSGSLIDALALRCAPLMVAGDAAGGFTVAPGAVTTQPPIGGSGGSMFPTADCAPGEIATGASIRHGDAIDAFGLRCSAPMADLRDRCAAVDCSAFDSECTTGVCDPGDGTCFARSLTDGAGCDDGDDACTSADVCGAGVCGGRPECPSALTLTDADDTVVQGNEGGMAAIDDCPEGQVLVGLDARVNMWMRRLAAVCGTPSVSGTPGAFVVTIGPGDTLPERGLHDGTAVSARCPDDEVVVGFEGRSGLLLDALALRCAPLSVARIATETFVVGRGAAMTQPAIGGSGGDAFEVTDCAAGAIASGAVIRHGDGVDAFGLRCSTPAAL